MHVDLTSRIFGIMIIGVVSAGFAPVFALLRIREGVLIVPSSPRFSPSWTVRREDDAETYWWYFGVIMVIFTPFTLVFLYCLYWVCTFGSWR